MYWTPNNPNLTRRETTRRVYVKQKKFAEVLTSKFPDCNMRSANSVTNASLFTQSAPVGVEVQGNRENRRTSQVLPALERQRCWLRPQDLVLS